MMYLPADTGTCLLQLYQGHVSLRESVAVTFQEQKNQHRINAISKMFTLATTVEPQKANTDVKRIFAS